MKRSFEKIKIHVNNILRKPQINMWSSKIKRITEIRHSEESIINIPYCILK